MVVPSLSLGAAVGVLLSGAFVYFEVGRYAAPQVPETLFEERREIFAYTAGLFVGVPFAVAYILYIISLAGGSLLSGLLFLAVLVVGLEVAQWALARSSYWGRGESIPFYALGFRAAVGGIISLALVAEYLSGPRITVDGIGLSLLQSVAVVSLGVTGALLSIPPRPGAMRSGGGPVPGAIFGAFGFFLIGVGTVVGEVGAFAGAGLAIVGAGVVYRGLRPSLATIPPPTAGPPAEARVRTPAYGRTKGLR